MPTTKLRAKNSIQNGYGVIPRGRSSLHSIPQQKHFQKQTMYPGRDCATLPETNYVSRKRLCNTPRSKLCIQEEIVQHFQKQTMYPGRDCATLPETNYVSRKRLCNTSRNKLCIQEEIVQHFQKQTMYPGRDCATLPETN